MNSQSSEHPPCLCAVDVCKSYPKTQTTALKNVDLTIFAGEFVCLQGASGSGKTTFLNIVAGLVEPTTGKIFFCGRPLDTYGSKAVYRRENIGYVFQDFYLYPHFSVLENVLLPFVNTLWMEEERVGKAVSLLKTVQLESKQNNPVNLLSAGERQRVCIARALMNDPPLILADEPTGNLDSENSALVMDFLKELNETRKSTIILVTHESQVAGYARRIIHIKDGEVENDAS